MGIVSNLQASNESVFTVNCFKILLDPSTLLKVRATLVVLGAIQSKTEYLFKWLVFLHTRN